MVSAGGFVTADDTGLITVPDYAGNRFFASLGNMLLTRRAGAVFVDFETGDLLQLTGDAEVVLDAAEVANFAHAERIWRLRPCAIVHRPLALPLHWERVPQPPALPPLQPPLRPSDAKRIEGTTA